jgi:hypothetical protein
MPVAFGLPIAVEAVGGQTHLQNGACMSGKLQPRVIRRFERKHRYGFGLLGEWVKVEGRDNHRASRQGRPLADALPLSVNTQPKRALS